MVANILVIDDDPGMIFLLTEQLNKNFSGISLTLASSGYQAIQILKEKSDFDLIISDYNMPDGNGIDVLKHLVISKHPIFFILHTSHLDPKLPEDRGDFFLGVIKKMDFDELNLMLVKLFVK